MVSWNSRLSLIWEEIPLILNNLGSSRDVGTLRHKCYIFALGTFYSIPAFSWSIAALKYFHLFLGNSWKFNSIVCLSHELQCWCCSGDCCGTFALGFHMLAHGFLKRSWLFWIKPDINGTRVWSRFGFVSAGGCLFDLYISYSGAWFSKELLTDKFWIKPDINGTRVWSRFGVHLPREHLACPHLKVCHISYHHHGHWPTALLYHHLSYHALSCTRHRHIVASCHLVHYLQ